MKWAERVSLLLFLFMTVSITIGLLKGGFWTEGAVIVDLLWGKLTLIDFYVGAALFSGWVIFRERSWIPSFTWIILIIVLGNWTTSLYVWMALRKNRGDWKAFWLGSQNKK